MSETGQSSAKWILWYEDLFDRECPRQIEASGTDVLEGLIELWKRHLQETVRDEGQKGFAHFNLSIVEDEVSVEIRGPREGQRKLRRWLTENPDQAPALLEKIAALHLRLIFTGRTSEVIIATSASCSTRGDFIDWLSEV